MLRQPHESRIAGRIAAVEVEQKLHEVFIGDVVLQPYRLHPRYVIRRPIESRILIFGPTCPVFPRPFLGLPVRHLFFSLFFRLFFAFLVYSLHVSFAKLLCFSLRFGFFRSFSFFRLFLFVRHGHSGLRVYWEALTSSELVFIFLFLFFLTALIFLLFLLLHSLVTINLIVIIKFLLLLS